MSINNEYTEAVRQLNNAWVIFNNEGTLSSIYNLKAAELRISELKQSLQNANPRISPAQNSSSPIISEIKKYFNFDLWKHLS